jgi:hypothetical protein
MLDNVTGSSYTGNLHYLDMVEHDLNFDDDDKEDYEGGFEEDGTSMPNKDDNFEDGGLVTSYTSSGSLVSVSKQLMLEAKWLVVALKSCDTSS